MVELVGVGSVINGAMEVAGNGWNGLKWLQMPEMAGVAGNGWKWMEWLEMDGHG